METNDIIRRRQTTISSGYRQGLLDEDYLVHGSKSSTSSFFDASLSHPSNSWSQRYVPPGTVESSPSKISSENMHQRHQYPDQNVSSLLYLSTPKPASIRRTIQSQTPSRTLVYNDITNEHPYNERLNQVTVSSSPSSPSNYNYHPAYDYGSDSLLSYGCCCMQCVRTTEVGILENFGRFEGLLAPGLHCIPWPLVDIGARLSLRIRQLELTCETRTSDSVFCNLVLTLQFRIIVERTYDAYYRLADPSHQIQSYVFDVIRSRVPKMTLDDVFSQKNVIAKEVEKHLQVLLYDYGYEILTSLLTDIRPSEIVVQSMNEINASKRLKVAMVYRAESEKIKRVKEAEAHCEALYLHGVGVAGQRNALSNEMKDSFKTFMEKQGDSQQEVMNLLLMTQYMDTLISVSNDHGTDNSNNLLCHGGPGYVFTMRDQLQALPGFSESQLV